MKATLLFIMIILSFSALAQENEEVLQEYLTNGKYRQWKMIGTASHLGTKSCESGGGYYTFYEDKLVIQECVNMHWDVKESSFKVATVDGEIVVLIDDKPYFYRKLSSSAPVCKDNDNCIRISYVAVDKDEFTTDIYLTY